MPAFLDSNKILFGDPPSSDELLSMLEDIVSFVERSPKNELSPLLIRRIKKLLERQQEAKSTFNILTK